MKKSFLVLVVILCVVFACSDKKTSNNSQNMPSDTTPRDQISVGDTVYLASGVKYVFLKKSDKGDFFGPDRVVSTHIILKANGNKVWSTYEPLQPFVFVQNQQPMIEGFKEAIKFMRVGDRIMAVIPSDLGYGPSGNGPSIPPNALLHFDIEILEIQ